MFKSGMVTRSRICKNMVIKFLLLAPNDQELFLYHFSFKITVK